MKIAIRPRNIACVTSVVKGGTGKPWTLTQSMIQHGHSSFAIPPLKWDHPVQAVKIINSYVSSWCRQIFSTHRKPLNALK